jgi:transcriptional regulator with XRE-family HTH domain
MLGLKSMKKETQKTYARQSHRQRPGRGTFAELVQDAMMSKKMKISDLAAATGATYEHIRKLVNSLAFPSGYLFERVCKALSLNREEANRALVADRMRYKYGTVPLELAGRNPRFEHIEKRLLKLTDEQIRMIEGIVDGLIKSNRQSNPF